MRLTFTHTEQNNVYASDREHGTVLEVRFDDRMIGYVQHVDGYHWILGKHDDFGRAELDYYDHYTSLDDAMYELTQRARREAIGHASVLEDEAFGWRTFADMVIEAEWK